MALTLNPSTVTDLVDITNDYGGYFFSPDTMKFFGTRLPDQKIYGGRYFITNDRKAPDGMTYTVRAFEILERDARGMASNIRFDTCDRFSTLKEARRHATELGKATDPEPNT